MSDQERISLTNPPAAPPAAAPDVGLTPPTEAVPLPSGGKIYPPDSPLHRAGLIEIRSMTARDEDILTSRALLKQGKAVDALLRSCILNKAIDITQMLTGDRNAVMVAIRITGYGADYQAQLDCPKCDEKVKATFDLSQLPIKPLGKEPREEGKNEFEFDLPVSKKKVVFKLLTGADEKDLSDLLSRTQKMGNGVEGGVTARLLMSIISLGGETDRNKLAQAIRNLPARDSRAFRAELDKVSPGVDMTQKFSCPSCGEESEVNVPIGTEFFWPEA